MAISAVFFLYVVDGICEIDGFRYIDEALLDFVCAVVVTTWFYFDSGSFHNDSCVLCRVFDVLEGNLEDFLSQDVFSTTFEALKLLNEGLAFG